MLIHIATNEDAKEISALQKLVHIIEAEIYDDYTIPPLHQKQSKIEADFEEKV